MDHIHELIQVLLLENNKHSLRTSLFSKKNSKVFFLFNCYLEHSDKTLDYIANQLNYSSSKSKAFLMMRSRLEKRLITKLVQDAIYIHTIENYKQSIANSLQLWACSRMLLLNSASSMSYHLMRKIYSQCQKYHFTELLLILSKDLKYYYSFKTPNNKNYKKYLEAYNHHLNIFQLEEKAERYYGELILRYTKLTKTKQSEFLLNENSRVKEIIGIISNYKSYRLCLISYVYLIVYYSFSNDYNQALALIDKALKYFNCLPFNAIIPIYSLNAEKLKYYIKYKRYNLARNVISRIENLPTPGSTNWFYLKFYDIIVDLHTKKYDKATDTIHLCLQHERFQYLSAMYQEFALIINGYIALIKMGGEKKPFRINKLINSLPTYNLNKRGLNISIQILFFLFLLKQHKYSRTIDRIESLNQYTYRYLRKGENYRSNCFIKMITQIPKANFHPERSRKLADKYYQALLSEPLEVANQPIDVEIIPYEDLWEITIGILEQNMPSRR